MRCPTLAELPAPPAGKTGWPWSEESDRLPDTHTNTAAWPRISVVTPSFNQARYLEQTIRSVLLQGYPDIELLIIDGGSTDGSIDLIRRYEPWISYWVSEKDRGQSHAVNKGFVKATGTLVGWQNSDDFYQRDCVVAASRAHEAHPEIAVLYGQVICVNAESQLVRENRAREFRLEDGIPWFDLANQCLFFRRDIFEAGLFLDESFHHCMDSEFYWRLIFAGFKFQYIPEMGGSFRLHGEAKTAKQQDVNQREAQQLMNRILKWPELPQQVRPVAMRRYCALLNTIFDRGDYELFRKGFRDFYDIAGWRSASFGLLARYVAALPGDAAAGLAARIRSMSQSRSA